MPLVVKQLTLINEPSHVSTQGALPNNGSIALATQGFILDVEYTEAIGSPNRDWWIREDKNDPLAGPFTFVEADRKARTLSKDQTKSGLAQVVTFLGSRGGDPVKNQTELRVVHLYIRGRRALAGRVAQLHSDRESPPYRVRFIV
jgi:hypothetical protein